jgi:choline dehydrogenase-like flavoprotein
VILVQDTRSTGGGSLRYVPGSRGIRNGSAVSCDICIIGSGAAGLTLGLELLGSGRRVAILESGGLEAAPSPDALYDLECARLPVAHDSRVRAFGGTTTVWSGRWKPHDAIDFLPREWVPHSGWPFPRETTGFRITKDASHHMGTTRMGTDPASSVADPDGRVHSVPNLYLAGSSLFPTGGYANPTATIAALAVRLADHVRGSA